MHKIETFWDYEMKSYKSFSTFIGEDSLPVTVTYWPYDEWKLGFQFINVKTNGRSIIDLLSKSTLDLLKKRAEAHEEANKREAMTFIGDLVEQDIQKAFETEKHTTQI